MKRVLFVILIGTVLGVGTLLGQRYLPGQLNQLANCYSLWLTASFIGGMLAVSRRQGALFGALVPVIALAAYYFVTGVIFRLVIGSLGIVAFWLGGGVTAGPLLGLLGNDFRFRERWAWLAPIVISALFLSEGAFQLWTLGYWVGYVFLALGCIAFAILQRQTFSYQVSIPLTFLLAAVLYVLYVYGLGALAQLLSTI